MDNATIASHFRLLAEIMELYGENSFKIKSYANAGRNLKKLDIELANLNETQLQEIPGIGKAIAEKIVVLAQTGKLPILESYLEKTPPGVVEMLQIKGIGPSKVAQLWHELHIESLGELYYACLENRLTLLKGFGEKTQDKIKDTIEFALQNANKQLFARVDKIWKEVILPYFEKTLGNNVNILPTGSYRSQEIIIEEMHLLMTGITIDDLQKQLKNDQWKMVIKDEKVEIFIPQFVKVIIEIVAPSQSVFRQFETTGSSEHRAFVKDRLSSPLQNIQHEEDIYQQAKLPYIPAECRDIDTSWLLKDSSRIENLVQVQDIKGVVHTHTVHSDGSNTIQELAKYCQDQGYEYLVLSDHSKSAFYANGLSVERIFMQQAEVDQIQSGMENFKIFKSIECDILYDGQMDYEDDVLKTFDLVIASVHSQLHMNEEKAMSRIIRAIENPFVNILGHMTGRLLLSRKGYPIDHKKIIDACKANGVVIELNANPHRLDIDYTWIPYCIDQGVLISINPDAHNLKGVHDIKYGVMAARKGGLTKQECINTYGADDFIKTIKSLK